MVASIGAVASPSQGASYYERDGYYDKDSPEHRAASAWAGRGASELGLEGPVDPDIFKAVLQGEVPDGSGKRLGRRIGDGEIHHRPGRDLTFSAPKSVSLAALVGGDERIVKAHDRAVGRALGWFEKNAAETRVQDSATGNMVRTLGQKAVIATFRHETSRNLDPALHTHSVIANMLQGADGQWRTMANERLYGSKMLLGALYRSELAGELKGLGYGVEKTHADGRFEIAGVSRETIEAFSTRRAEIEAAMEARGLGTTGESPHLARRAALMTRAHKRDVDREALCGTWALRAAELDFDAQGLAEKAMQRSLDGSDKAAGSKGTGRDGAPELTHQMGLFEPPAPADRPVAAQGAAREAVDWALTHLSERDAVFAGTDLFAAALAFSPGSASIGAIERAVDGLKRDGRLHDAPALKGGGGLTTDKALADERETIALMRTGQRRGKAPMRGWMVDRHLRKGPLTVGQKEAVKLILSEKDRTVGVQGYAGTGKTTMLNRARTLAGKKGLAPGRARPIRFGGADAGGRIGNRERNPAAVPGPKHGRRRRPAHPQGCESAARGVRENGPGRRRGLARLHRPGSRSAPDRTRAAHSEAGSGRGFQTTRRGGCRQTVCATAGRRHEDRRHGRDHAPEESGAESGRSSESGGRNRQGVRKARRPCRRSQPRQHCRRGRRALAETVAAGERTHRRHGPQPCLAAGSQ